MKTPELNIDAQEALIGCALLGAASDIAAENVQSTLFTDPSCREAWGGIEKLLDQGAEVSLVTVKGETNLDLTWLMALPDKAPTQHNWSHWLPKVKDASARYRIWELSLETAQEASTNEANIDELTAKFEASMLAINDVSADVSDVTKPGWIELCDILADAGQPGDKSGIKSGFTRYDAMTRGLKPGTMHTVAGRPGMGKSAFAFNVAHKAALEGKHVLLFSAEMRAPDCLSRIVAIDSGEDVQGYIEKGWRESAPRIAGSVTRCKDLPIHVVDSTSLNTAQMRAYARKLAKKGQLDLVVVDYLQLFKSPEKAYSREAEVSQVSRAIKLLSMESAVPVICLAQMNRQVEGREGEPRLSDLRESGSIEQDSDTVSFLWRNPADGMLALCLKKNRNGPVGNVPFEFITYNQRFEEIGRLIES